jgi:hypothetical protein
VVFFGCSGFLNQSNYYNISEILLKMALKTYDHHIESPRHMPLKIQFWFETGAKYGGVELVY